MLLKQQQLLVQQQQQQQLEYQKQLLIQQQNALNMNLFMQPTPVAQPQPYNQPYSQPYGMPNQLYGGLSLNPPPAQPFSFGASAYPQAPTAPVYQPFQASTAPSTSAFNFGAPATNQITLSENTKKDDDFGSFESAPSQSTANVSSY